MVLDFVKDFVQNRNKKIGKNGIKSIDYLDIAVIFFVQSVLEGFGESIISQNKVKIANRLHLVMNFGV